MAGFDERRFGGVVRLYGRVAAERLAVAHVAVVGVGGVGSWAAEALVRTGVGEITLIDLDDLCITNCNRQLPATTSTVGKSKVEVMAQRLRDINPQCRVHEVLDFVTADNLAERLHDELDAVLDCIDSVSAKAALIAWCKHRKIQVVCTGGAGGQIDPTAIRVADLNKTFNDPLLAKVRSLLRRQYGFSRTARRHYSVPCVFSSEQLRYPQADGSVCTSKGFTAEQGVRLDCSGGFGSTVMVTASFGMTAAARIVDRLAGGARRPAERNGILRPQGQSDD